MQYEDDKKTEKLPAMLDYNDKPVSSAVLSYRYYISPSNGGTFSSTISNGAVIRMEIPAATQGHHLNPAETALIFSVKNSSGSAMVLDGSAFAFIKNVQVFYGSTLISSIDNYDCFATAMSDFSSSGAHYTRGVADLDAGAINARNGRTIAAGGSDTFSLPMVNLLGTLCQKGLALSQLRDSIRVEFQFNDIINSATYTTTPTGTLDFSNIKLWLTNVQISSSVENALMKTLGGIVQTPCFDVENYRGSIGGNTTAFSYQIPVRVSSLTSVFFCLREGAVFNNFANRSLSRTGGNLKSYNFRCGSATIPSSPISCEGNGIECRTELMRAMNAIGSAQSDSFITSAVYNAGGATAMATGAYGGRFYGLQLSAFAASELLSDGKNLKTGETLVLDLQFNAGGVQPLQLDVWCVFEKVLTIQQSVLTYKN